MLLCDGPPLITACRQILPSPASHLNLPHMQRRYIHKVAKVLLALSCAIFFFLACDRPAKPVKETIAPDITTVRAGMLSANEDLPVLFISVDELDRVRGNITFRFYVDSAFDLTLHGWKPPFNNNPPEVKLQTSAWSGVKMAPGSYLGNLYIKANQVNDVIAWARSLNATQIRFIPMIDTRAGSAGQIIYRLVPSTIVLRPRTMFSTDSMMNLIDTTGSGVTTTIDNLLNPSPPRNEQ